MGTKVTVCRYCKEEIKKGAKTCPHCGKNQGMSCGGTIIASIVIIALMVFALRACNSAKDGYDNASENASISSEAEEIGEDEYKSLCRSASYEDIARDKNALNGEKLTFTGEIIQVVDDTYRINITKTDYGYSDTIIFEIDSDRLKENILEGDIVTIWGESKGFVSYESIMGENITVPDIRAIYILNSGQAEE